MDSDFKNFENDDVIAVILAFTLLNSPKEKATLSVIFVKKSEQCYCLLRLTNHSSAFQLVSSMKLNILYLAPVSGTRKV